MSYLECSPALGRATMCVRLPTSVMHETEEKALAPDADQAELQAGPRVQIKVCSPGHWWQLGQGRPGQRI